MTLAGPDYYNRAFVDNTHAPLVEMILGRDRVGIAAGIDSLREVCDELATAWSVTTENLEWQSPPALREH